MQGGGAGTCDRTGESGSSESRDLVEITKTLPKHYQNAPCHWGVFLCPYLCIEFKKQQAKRAAIINNKKNKGMKKIVIGNKVEFEKLKAAFPSTHKSTVYKALRFEAKSLLASRIRCYAMNFLPSAQLLTTH